MLGPSLCTCSCARAQARTHSTIVTHACQHIDLSSPSSTPSTPPHLFRLGSGRIGGDGGEGGGGGRDGRVGSEESAAPENARGMNESDGSMKEGYGAPAAIVAAVISPEATPVAVAGPPLPHPPPMPHPLPDATALAACDAEKTRALGPAEDQPSSACEILLPLSPTTSDSWPNRAASTGLLAPRRSLSRSASPRGRERGAGTDVEEGREGRQGCATSPGISRARSVGGASAPDSPSESLSQSVAGVIHSPRSSLARQQVRKLSQMPTQVRHTHANTRTRMHARANALAFYVRFPCFPFLILCLNGYG